MKNKRCSKCKKKFPLEKFCKNKSGKYGRHHYCRRCLSAQKKVTYVSNDAIRDRLKQKQIERNHGLCIAEIEEMLVNQGNRCLICGKSFDNTKHFIDHNHISGVVRGILCPSCNTMIGLANDNIGILTSAINYLSAENVCLIPGIYYPPIRH